MINDLYKKLFESKELEIFRKAVRSKRKIVQQEFTDRIHAEQKKRQPRRRVNFDPLPVELIKEWRKELHMQCNYDEDEQFIKDWRDTRETSLDNLAPKVIFLNDLWWHKVDSCHTASYGSQGYGMHRYTKDSLKPLLHKLQFFGIVAEIRWRLTAKASGRWSCGDSGLYEVWAACPEYLADAAKRLITLADWSQSVGRTTNLKVYNPFVSDEILNKHFQGNIK